MPEITPDDCRRCEGTGRIEPFWPVGPGGAHLSDYECSTCKGTGKLPTSRPVMNSPADEAEARDRANTAPRQADPAAPGRGETGASSGSEARPVTATERLITSKDLGSGLRVQVSPGTTALNLHDERYGVMIPMKWEQAAALRDWITGQLRSADETTNYAESFKRLRFHAQALQLDWMAKDLDVLERAFEENGSSQS